MRDLRFIITADKASIGGTAAPGKEALGKGAFFLKGIIPRLGAPDNP